MVLDRSIILLLFLCGRAMRHVRVRAASLARTLFRARRASTEPTPDVLTDLSPANLPTRQVLRTVMMVRAHAAIFRGAFIFGHDRQNPRQGPEIPRKTTSSPRLPNVFFTCVRSGYVEGYDGPAQRRGAGRHWTPVPAKTRAALRAHKARRPPSTRCVACACPACQGVRPRFRQIAAHPKGPDSTEETFLLREE